MSAAAPNITAMPQGMSRVAYELARQGFRVHPLRHSQKLPMWKGWKTRATTDLFTVLEQWPGDAAPGIATGHDFTVIDVEKAGVGTDDVALQLPPTLTVATPRGGRHFYFRTPPNQTFGNSCKHLAPNTDVRGVGGLVAGPGATFRDPETGEIGTYTVINTTPAVDLPANIIEKMRAAPVRAAIQGQVIGDVDAPHSVKRALEYLTSEGEAPFHGPGRNVLPGARGYTTYRAAGRLGDFGVSCDKAKELLAEWNAQHCSPPQEQEELEAAIEHSYEYRLNAIGCDNPLAHFAEAETYCAPLPQAPGNLSGLSQLLWQAGAIVRAGWEAQTQTTQRVALEAPQASALTGQITPGAEQPKQQQPSDLLEFPADIALADLLKQEANALVRGILHLGEQGCVYGLPGAGKSFIGVDLGFHIGLGKDWHGRKVTRAPVLYVALEGVRGFRKRMYAAKERLGDPGNFFSRLKVHISLMRQAAGDAGASTIMAAAKALAEKCGQPVGLIVIDTLARAVSGDDENAVEDMMAYLEGRAGAIARETGAHVLTVHHPNAEGKLRGSTSLPAAFDAILRVDVDSSGRRTLVGQKIKDDEDGPLFDFELEKVHLGVDEYGQPASSCVVRTVTRAAIEPEPKKGEKVWHESFEALREAGKLTQCTGSDGATVGVRANLNDLKQEFLSAYGTKEPDKAWRRTLAACPDGFVKLKIEGGECIWFPL